MQTILQLEDITPSWLTQKLRACGALLSGEVVSVSRKPLQTAQAIFATAASIEVAYSDTASGTMPKHLFLKMSRSDLHPEVLAWGKREVNFYLAARHMDASLPIPRCYDAAYDPETHHSHLLIDDLSSTHFQRLIPPSVQHCTMLMEALADLHAQWWNVPPHLRNELDEPYNAEDAVAQHIRLEATYPRFMDEFGNALLPTQRAIFEHVLRSSLWQRREDRRRVGMGTTLVHGDAHLGNYFFPYDVSRDRVMVIDWQLWDITVGTDDLAFLIAHKWSPQRRAILEQRLLRSYYDRLIAAGVESYTWDACWQDYRESVALTTLVPIGQFRRKQHPATIWGGLENITAAFDDLNCEEFL